MNLVQNLLAAEAKALQLFAEAQNRNYIQAGITEVVYLSDKYNGQDSAVASRRMLETAGVTCRKVNTSLEELTLSFRESDV